MMPINAFGHVLAMASTRSLTILALVLNKSSRVIPKTVEIHYIKHQTNMYETIEENKNGKSYMYMVQGSY